MKNNSKIIEPKDSEIETIEREGFTQIDCYETNLDDLQGIVNNYLEDN